MKRLIAFKAYLTCICFVQYIQESAERWTISDFDFGREWQRSGRSDAE